jgi:DNA polymerase-3 subunit delta'
MRALQLQGQVIITEDIPKTIEEVKALLTNERLVVIAEESFKVEHANLAIEKAYMASKELTIILLSSDIFTPIIQNRLLKIIEEPPSNTLFILLTKSKATVLPTISSRLPVVIHSHKVVQEEVGIDVANLTLEHVYTFTKEHQHTPTVEMKGIIETIITQALKEKCYTFDESTLTLFSNATKALNVGSPSSFVLNTVLLKLLARRKRH